jgi:hypothetical protein
MLALPVALVVVAARRVVLRAALLVAVLRVALLVALRLVVLPAAVVHLVLLEVVPLVERLRSPSFSAVMARTTR